jgi:hypothetical protein
VVTAIAPNALGPLERIERCLGSGGRRRIEVIRIHESENLPLVPGSPIRASGTARDGPSDSHPAACGRGPEGLAL